GPTPARRRAADRLQRRVRVHHDHARVLRSAVRPAVTKPFLAGMMAAAASWCAASARAQGPDPAQIAEDRFQEGRPRMNEARVADACPLFEESHRAAPSFGALFNLAECHEQLGRTASAWAEFRGAEALAQASGQTARRDKAARRAAAL